MCAEHGQLHPLVVTPSKLMMQLQEIQPHLEYNSNFPLPLNKRNVNLFYQFINVHVYYYKKKLNFVLEIPLVTTLLYDVYKVSAVPVLLEKDLYTFVLPEKPFIAIDQLKQHFFLLNENSLKTCIKIDALYICKQNTPVLILQSNENCEATLLSRPEKIPDSCDHRIMKQHKTLFIQLSKLNCWLFVSPKTELIYFNCLDRKSSLALNGTGILQVQPGCTVYTSSAVLNSEQSFFSHLGTNNFLLQANITKTSLPNFEKINLTKSILDIKPLIHSDQFESLNRFSHKVKILKDHIQQAESMNSFFQ